jgi:hypothetical protein
MVRLSPRSVRWIQIQQGWMVKDFTVITNENLDAALTERLNLYLSMGNISYVLIRP